MTKARTLADNFAADINGITAGTGITGGGTSGTVTITNDMATTIDAKGDLVVGTGADTYDNLAAGANGETLVADSSASVGLRYQEPKAGNPVINSAFQVWQRGTSFTIGNGYTADRWYTYSAGAGRTLSRQTTSDTTNLPNIQYAARVQRDSGNTATNEVQFYNLFETVNSIPFAGKTLTLSFYARRGANYAPSTANAMEYEVNSGPNTDNNPISSGTWNNKFINGNVTLTTTWQRFSFSGTMPATDTQLFIRFRPGGNAYTGTAGANDWFEVTGVQLEVGSVATPFKTQGVTLAGELAACQRYYFRKNSGNTNYTWFAWGIGQGSSQALFAVPAPVTMRTTPTVIEFANLGLAQTGAINAITTLVHSNSSPDTAFLQSNGTNTADVFYRLIANNSASAYIGIGAEL